MHARQGAGGGFPERSQRLGERFLQMVEVGEMPVARHVLRLIPQPPTGKAPSGATSSGVRTEDAAPTGLIFILAGVLQICRAGRRLGRDIARRCPRWHFPVVGQRNFCRLAGDRKARAGGRRSAPSLPRRDAGNGHRDGRAPRQRPSRVANGSLGWTNGAKGV